MAQKGSTYWNRHNSSTIFPPGRTEWTIPVRGLYRGEAGSRNNDIKRDIDPDSIARVDFGFGARGSEGSVVIDALRLVKAARPAGVWAFDFGPPSQAAMLGWTAVSHATAYSRALGYGWGPRGGTPWDGADRDTTFGPALIRDFCEAGGYSFHVDVPAGTYRVMLIYENSGYWGGEQAMHTTRRVLVGGQVVYHEERPDGAAYALYRFEDVEPIGANADIWDTYMAPELARPVGFDAQAGPDGLTLRFESDRPWGSKLSCLALYRKDDTEAASWLKGQMDALAAEFRRMAVCLDEPAPAFDAPAAWKQRGLVAWPVRIEDDVKPNSVPPAEVASPDAIALSALAVQDEFEPLCIALRPLRDLGVCRLELEPLAGPGRLDAVVQVVHYNTSRGFGTIAYHVRAHTLRPAESVALPAGVTRELVVTAHAAADSPPGDYAGALGIVGPDGAPVLRVPLRLTVAPVRLERRTDFLMGYYGLMPPPMVPKDRRWDVLAQTLDMLKDHGANAVSGGPSWRLTGWAGPAGAVQAEDASQMPERAAAFKAPDKASTARSQPAGPAPVIDYGDMDRFFALLKAHGFDRAVNGYGGERFQGLHDGYEKGATGARVEQQSGLPYEEALMRAWSGVDEHARAAGWPTILYAMCDETRVRDVAERQLDFMQMMAKVSAAFPQTVRTSGSYSVSFASRPTDKDDLTYWHQRFFETLDISALNAHDPSVMAEARRLGKEVQIYNQGRSRYSFGLYQWSEFAKGVAARWQWHLNILHGYQFFDLDGREPDTAMICYGREGLLPTMAFERCREGAEDFYLMQTLQDAVERARQSGAPAKYLDALSASVKLNQRTPPARLRPLRAEGRDSSSSSRGCREDRQGRTEGGPSGPVRVRAAELQAEPALAGRPAGRGEGVQRGAVLVGDLHLQRAQVVVQLLDRAHAGDRAGDARLAQAPGQGKLAGRAALLPRHRLHRLDHAPLPLAQLHVLRRVGAAGAPALL